MKNNLVEMVFILDCSGSMQGLEKDTIGGFNSMIEKQKKVEGKAIISTVFFNHDFKVIHNRKNIEDIIPITEKDYYVSGTTALLDAIGRSVHKISNIQNNIPDEFRADKVIFVITTDGMENSSREYNYKTLKQMIERQKEKYGWEFVFLGANIDSQSVASQVGINKDRVANYHADEEGTKIHFKAISNALMNFRTSDKLSDDWMSEIDKDYKKRK